MDFAALHFVGDAQQDAAHLLFDGAGETQQPQPSVDEVDGAQRSNAVEDELAPIGVVVGDGAAHADVAHLRFHVLQGRVEVPAKRRQSSRQLRHLEPAFAALHAPQVALLQFPFGQRDGRRRGLRKPRLPKRQQPIPQLPRLQAVEGQGLVVAQVVLLQPQRHVQAFLDEELHRAGGEAQQVVERDFARAQRRLGFRQDAAERPGRGAFAGGCARGVGHRLGKAEKAACAVEVARAEGLQRMDGLAPLLRPVGEARGEIFRQLVDHDGRRNRAVFAHVAPGVGDDEEAPRRQQRFEKREAILVAQIAVADTAPILGHGIEGRLGLVARERPVVHAGQANHLGRKDLAARQPPQRGPVGEAGDGAHRRVAKRGDCRAQRLEGNGRGAVGEAALLLELVDQGRHRVNFRHAGQVGEERRQNIRAQGFRPFRRRALLVHPRGKGEKLLQVAEQTAKLHVFARADVEAGACQRTGDDALHRRRVVADGIAEQQPANALAPGVAGGGGHAEGGQMRGVDAPANAGALQAAAQRVQALLVDAEAQLHRPRPQRRQHGAAAVARTGQGENVQKGLHGSVVAPPATADVDGNRVGGGKHGFDCRRVVLQCRRENQHVRRLDVWVRVENGEQAVVQHFRLAHRGVADVDLQRVVVLGDVVPARGVFRAAQFEDVLLHCAEPRRRIGIAVDFERVANAEFVRQQRLHVARRAAPEREQLVAQRRCGEAVAWGCFFRAGIVASRATCRSPLPRRAGVCPELAARAQHVEMHVHQLRRAAQHVQIGWRQPDDAEEARPGPRRRTRRQRQLKLPGTAASACVRVLLGAGDGCHEGVDGIDPMRRFLGAVREQLPQPRLPMRRLAALPRADPLGAVQQAAVVDHRQPVGQRVAAALEQRRRGDWPRRGFRLGAQIAPQGIVALPALELRFDSPAQARRRKGLLSGQGRHRIAHRRPGELGRQFDAQVRRDAKLARQRQTQPAAKRGMGNDDALRRVRLARLGSHPRRKLLRENLQPVRGAQLQAGGRDHDGGRTSVVSVSAFGVQHG